MKVSQVTAAAVPVPVLLWKVSRKKQNSFRTKGELRLRLKQHCSNTLGILLVVELQVKVASCKLSCKFILVYNVCQFSNQ